MIDVAVRSQKENTDTMFQTDNVVGPDRFIIGKHKCSITIAIAAAIIFAKSKNLNLERVS